MVVDLVIVHSHRNNHEEISKNTNPAYWWGLFFWGVYCG
jgi:hypothetical protein